MGDRSLGSLLASAHRGDRKAILALFPIVYEELRAIARRQRGRWRGDTSLNTTAVVHEAFIKLEQQGRVEANSRSHFIGIAAKAMRHILCNHARDRRREKRGGGAAHVPLHEAEESLLARMPDQHAELLEAMDAALERLALLDPRQSRVVECRFFADLSIEETAAILDVSEATVKRDWAMARAWLYRELQTELGEASGAGLT